MFKSFDGTKGRYLKCGDSGWVVGVGNHVIHEHKDACDRQSCSLGNGLKLCEFGDGRLKTVEYWEDRRYSPVSQTEVDRQSRETIARGFEYPLQ